MYSLSMVFVLVVSGLILDRRWECRKEMRLAILWPYRKADTVAEWPIFTRGSPQPAARSETRQETEAEREMQRGKWRDSVNT